MAQATAVALLTARDLERFWAKVDTSGGPDACWPWTAARLHFGHGAFRVGNRQAHAHRVAFQIANGPMADGVDVLHHCDNPPCCNARHLYAGTPADNARDRGVRGRAVNVLTARNRAKTRCVNGHPFTPENTKWRRNRNGRRKRTCRVCYRLWQSRAAKTQNGRERSRQKNRRQYARRKAAKQHF